MVYVGVRQVLQAAGLLQHQEAISSALGVEQFHDLLDTVHHIPQHDYSKHQYHKDIMYEASRLIIRNAKNASDTIEQRQY